MTSMSYQYLLGLTTVSNIISETCEALWFALSKNVLSYPFTKEKWLSISEEFENIWNFNHCIGAIDGKHIIIQVSFTQKFLTLLKKFKATKTIFIIYFFYCTIYFF